MVSKWKQSSIHRIMVLIIFAVAFIILGTNQIQAASSVPGCTLLAWKIRPKSGPFQIDNYIKIWEFGGNGVHCDMSQLDNKQTYILIHGNGAGPAGDNWPPQAAQAIRATEQGKNSQILLIDWEDDASIFAADGIDPDNADVLPNVILTIIYLFSNVKRIDHIEIIGHSYGAHIGGYLAQTGVLGTVDHLVALDPATEKEDLKNACIDGKLIYQYWLNLRNKTYVETYMSSSVLGNSKDTYGNYNFVVADNNLTCNDFKNQSRLSFSDHSRAWKFYLGTINSYSTLGWGWYNYGGKKEGGKKEYENKGISFQKKQVDWCY